MSAGRFFPRDEYYMRLALREAERALEHDDVPIGAVLVRDGEVLAAACNERELRSDPTAHAEILALREAGSKLGGWRIADSVLYVTIEPCAMCAGRDRLGAGAARRLRRARPEGRRGRQRARRARRAAPQLAARGRRRPAGGRVRRAGVELLRAPALAASLMLAWRAKRSARREARRLPSGTLAGDSRPPTGCSGA